MLDVSQLFLCFGVFEEIFTRREMKRGAPDMKGTDFFLKRTARTPTRAQMAC